MKEIISFYVGQAGVQIGSSIWELFCAEHNISCDGLLRDNQLENECLETFFNETSANTWVPRSLFVDLEPSVVDEIRKGIFKNLFHPERLISGPEDASNNFSRGFFTVGKLILPAINEQSRHLFEQCDMAQGVIILRSLGGGTGAGLTSAMFEGLSDYQKTPKIEIPIYPSPTLSTSMVEPYNCLLGEHFCMEDIDVGLLLDNEALFEICSKYLVINYPTYNTINRLIAQVVSSITASVRFVNVLNCDLTVLQTNMVPYPRIHFPLCNFAPIMNQEKANHQELTVQQLTRLVFDRNNQMMKVDHFYGKFMSCALFYRGNVCPHHVYMALSEIKRDQSIEFVDWCPTGFKVGINAVSPVIIPDSKLAATKKNVAMLTNTSAIGQAWQRLTHRFYLLYSKRSFVHWFVGEGMEECEFTEALYNISALVKDYEEAGENTTSIVNNIDSGSNKPDEKRDDEKDNEKDEEKTEKNTNDNCLKKDEVDFNTMTDKSASNSILKSSLVWNNKSELSRLNSEDNGLTIPKIPSNLSLDQSNKSNQLFAHNLEILNRIISIDLNENVIRCRKRQNYSPEHVSVTSSSKCFRENSKLKLLKTNSNFSKKLNPNCLFERFLNTPKNGNLPRYKKTLRRVSTAVTTLDYTSFNSDLDNGSIFKDTGTDYKPLEISNVLTYGHKNLDFSKRPSSNPLNSQEKYIKSLLSDCTVSSIHDSVPKIPWGLKSSIENMDASLFTNTNFSRPSSVENPQHALNHDFADKMMEIQQCLVKYFNKNYDTDIAEKSLYDLFNLSTDNEKSDELSCKTVPILSQSEFEISRESDLLNIPKGVRHTENICTVLELKSNSQTGLLDRKGANFLTSHWNSFINNLSENTQMSDSETISGNSQSNCTLANNFSKDPPSKLESNMHSNSHKQSVTKDLTNWAEDESGCSHQDSGFVKQIIKEEYSNEYDSKSNHSKDSQVRKMSISHNWKPLDKSKDTYRDTRGFDSLQSGSYSPCNNISQVLKFQNLNESIHPSERPEDSKSFITNAIVSPDNPDNSLTSDKDCHQMKCTNNNGSTPVRSSKTFKVASMSPRNQKLECTKIFLSNLSPRSDIQSKDSIPSNENVKLIPRKFRNHLLDEENESRSNQPVLYQNRPNALPENPIISRKKFMNEMFDCMLELSEKETRKPTDNNQNPVTTSQTHKLQWETPSLKYNSPGNEMRRKLQRHPDVFNNANNLSAM